LEIPAGTAGFGSGRKPSDQFWPASAFDPATGLLWVCYYDTRWDDTRRTASYACAATPNGRRWIGPKRVASVASDESRPPAARFEFGDYEGLAVARGLAHPIWTDSRELPRQLEEIFTTGAQLR